MVSCRFGDILANLDLKGLTNIRWNIPMQIIIFFMEGWKMLTSRG
jgi:hypothetical protein